MPNAQQELEKYKKVMKAIKLATGKGDCKYITDDKPACVIAQLGALEGISKYRMSRWSNANILSVIDKQELHKYDNTFLRKLQQMWDTMKAASVHKAKEEMRKYTKQHFGVKD